MSLGAPRDRNENGRAARLQAKPAAGAAGAKEPLVGDTLGSGAFEIGCRPRTAEEVDIDLGDLLLAEFNVAVAVALITGNFAAATALIRWRTLSTWKWKPAVRRDDDVTAT